MHCNLRPPEAPIEPRQPFSHYNYDEMPSLKLPNLSIAVYYNAFADDTLLYAVTLTFGPKFQVEGDVPHQSFLQLSQ